MNFFYDLLLQFVNFYAQRLKFWAFYVQRLTLLRPSCFVELRKQYYTWLCAFFIPACGYFYPMGNIKFVCFCHFLKYFLSSYL